MKIEIELMGILNLTPDSFSDGGRYFQQPEKALQKIKTLALEGANIIDLGAESTRPGAQDLDAEEEIQRLLPVLSKIAISSAKISLDSRKAKTVDFFLQRYKEKIDFVNDVSSLEDPEMSEILAKYFDNFAWQGSVILTHHRGIPASKKDLSRKTNLEIIDEIIDFFQLKLEKLKKVSFPDHKIILDPGLGFGKNLEENLLIIKNINRLKENFGLKILVGHSRKRFISQFFALNSGFLDLKIRDLASHNFALLLTNKKIDIIRSHEIKTLKNLLNLLT